MDITNYLRDKKEINIPSIEFRIDDTKYRSAETFSDEVIYEALTIHLQSLSQSIKGLRQRINESLMRMNASEERNKHG